MVMKLYIPDEQVSASQDGLCFMQLVISYTLQIINWNLFKSTH